MRCIETTPTPQYNIPLLWLIETWDVLKHSLNRAIIKRYDRLIETWDVLKPSSEAETSSEARLIETWDVLKQDLENIAVVGSDRLIETWDVLKLLGRFWISSNHPD